jgi:tape measure domain-containing protein
MAIGKLLLKLGIDTTNLDKELGKVEKSMTKFGQNMSNLGSTLTQSLTLPIIGVGAAALKSFADIEKLQNGLIAIMGNSEAAAIELEKLRKVAENPGLALPEVVKASASLQSVGMNADAARETIVQFGNAVARAGGGAEQFDGVVLALSQISAVGKVTQEDLNQIKERLPEFARVMKEEFGVVTAEGIRELGISSEEFIKRSVGALGNLQRANGGLANTFDNLKDNVGASLAELGKAINETLNLEAVVATFSAGLQKLVDGFKSLNPETQGFIVNAALIVAAIGPAIFIVGKLITTFGALVGTIKLIRTTILFMTTGVQAAFASLLANPVILGIVAAIAAIGAIALYVYDNWEAFASRFQNIWINIKNSTMKGVADFMKNIDKLQKFLGIELFNVSGLTNYTEQQRVVQKEFKSIGETVDSLKGKFKSLFTTTSGKPITAATEGTGELVFGDGGAPTGGGTGGVGGGTSPISAITAESTGITNMLPTLDLLAIKLDTASASNQRLKETNEEVKNSFVSTEAQMMSFGNTMTSALIAATDAFANLAVQGETDMKKLGSAAMQAARMIISAYIKEGVAGIIKGILGGPLGKALGPGALAVAGAAGAGAAVLFNTMLNKVAPPKLAMGGLAYGPTMATVGDNRNARVDPEVIAPLSKLKGMLDGGGSPYILTTRVAGSDLLVIMEKARNINSRIR